jgi:hypothetical protein
VAINSSKAGLISISAPARPYLFIRIASITEKRAYVRPSSEGPSRWFDIDY